MTRWQDPPPGGTGRKPGEPAFAREAGQLRANPGEWMRVRDYGHEQDVTARSVGVRIRQGGYPAFRPAEAWQAETHAFLSGRKEMVGIWVRYVGERGEYRNDAKPDFS
jgi:hypothetical protein